MSTIDQGQVPCDNTAKDDVVCGIIVAIILLYLSYMALSALISHLESLDKERKHQIEIQIATAFEQQQGEHVKSVDLGNRQKLLVTLYDGRVILVEKLGDTLLMKGEVDAQSLVKLE
jgi:hypothetical protein